MIRDLVILAGGFGAGFAACGWLCLWLRLVGRSSVVEIREGDSLVIEYPGAVTAEAKAALDAAVADLGSPGRRPQNLVLDGGFKLTGVIRRPEVISCDFDWGRPQ